MMKIPLQFNIYLFIYQFRMETFIGTLKIYQHLSNFKICIKKSVFKKTGDTSRQFNNKKRKQVALIYRVIAGRRLPLDPNCGPMKGRSLRYMWPMASCTDYHKHRGRVAQDPYLPSPWLGGMRSLRPGGTPGENLENECIVSFRMKIIQHPLIWGWKVYKIVKIY